MRKFYRLATLSGRETKNPYQHERYILVELSLVGLFLGIVLYCLFISPSLLPRKWFWHGFIGAIGAGFGYAAGWALATFVLPRSWAEAHWPRATTVIVWVAIIVLAVFVFIQGYRWARQVATAAQMPGESFISYCAGTITAWILGAALYALIRGFLWIVDRAYRMMGNWLWKPVAVVLACALLIVLVRFFALSVVYPILRGIFTRSAKARNARGMDDIAPPTVPEKSGSPNSLVSWESAGAHGRVTLSRSVSRHDIETFTGREALEPIRAYGGIVHDPATGSIDIDATARNAVQELKRAGGLTRGVINIAAGTGSGWLNEWLVEPLEYLTEGDCATVSMQYSYLFSALILLEEPQLCQQAARSLFTAIEEELEAVPPEERPLLILTGESLGAFGSQETFVSFADAVARCDGAIWSGTPGFATQSRLGKSGIWSHLTAHRAPGSPVIAPVYDSGKHARFVPRPQFIDEDDAGRPLGPWHFPRFAFAQHGNDPVVWFANAVATRRPGFLDDADLFGVAPTMFYMPLITYLQMIVDLPSAGEAPGGRGHTYEREMVPLWAKVLGIGEIEQRRRLHMSRSWEGPELERLSDTIAERIRASGRR